MLKIDPRLTAQDTLVPEPVPDVAEDVERAQSSLGPQRLKNAVEREIVNDWSLPGRLLDAGIGTGRMGLALVARDRDITGVDRSAEMLERCRIESAGRVTALVAGDLGTLSFANDSFDTACAIDALSPNSWMLQLQEMLRVVRPGGRVIVNIESVDHFNAASLNGRGGPPESSTRDAVSVGVPLPRLAVDQISAFASRNNVRLREIIPYGAVFGRLIENRWFGGASGPDADRLERLVSWIGTDEALFSLATFIERRIIGALTPQCAPRMVVVLSCEPVDSREPECVTRFARLDAAIRTRWLDLGDIAARHEGGAAAWSAQLADVIAEERQRIFAAALFAFARCGPLWPGLAAHLPPAMLRELTRAQRFSDSAAEAARLTARWPEAVGSALLFHGVRLGPALAPAVEREIAASLRALR